MIIDTEEKRRDAFKIITQSKFVGFDTETSSLHPYLRGELVGVSFCSGNHLFYYNFHDSGDFVPLEKSLLTEATIVDLRMFFEDESKVWFAHNAKFDMHWLWKQFTINIAGTVHCTQAIARLENSQHMQYSLDACAKRIGEDKNSEVEDFIKEHKLWEWETVPGRKTRKKNKFYYKVPLPILSKYAEHDAYLTYRLGRHQIQKIGEIDEKLPASVPTLRVLMENERAITKIVSRMERTGIAVDRPYCLQAARSHTLRAENAYLEYFQLTGTKLVDSPKSLSGVFSAEESVFSYTAKGSVSFDAKALTRLKHPAARAVLDYRDAKKRSDVFNSLLYFADRNSTIHPNFNPNNTRTGRFSSSDPNFQNLAKTKDIGSEFPVRRALIPRPNHAFLMVDCDQMEYRLMLDQTCKFMRRESDLVKRIKEEGLDVHDATAKECVRQGLDITRDQAKTVNFALLYGSGIGALSAGLGCTLEQARDIKRAVLTAAPEMGYYINAVKQRAEGRGYVFNWMGRRYHFPDPKFAYRAPNYLIQGGCADIIKIGMVAIDQFLSPMKSNLLLQIHDELVFECPKEELAEVATRVPSLLSCSYNHVYLPITAGVEYSEKSLADKEAWNA